MTARELPSEVGELARVVEKLRNRYSESGLSFTPDGNLVGDLGEAIAAEDFSLNLVARNEKGIDGNTTDGRSVQVKATGGGRGVAFTDSGVEADVLLVLQVSFESCSYQVIYNGPYARVRPLLPDSWQGQKLVTLNKLKALEDGTGGI